MQRSGKTYGAADGICSSTEREHAGDLETRIVLPFFHFSRIWLEAIASRLEAMLDIWNAGFFYLSLANPASPQTQIHWCSEDLKLIRFFTTNCDLILIRF